MNNVIQDLAKYAAAQLKEDMVNNPDAPSYDEIFAELIVAECVAAIMTKDRYRREYFARVVQRRFGMLDDGDDDE
jgi:hypothetical protein